MTEELKVVKGEKVAESWGGKEEIANIYTVVSVSKKGTITVETDTGRRYQFKSDGWSKGQANGKIRKLEEGEEAERARKYEKCLKWVQENAWDINSIQTVNCTLYIVSLPIPSEPCTLILRFDKRIDYGGETGYSVSIGINHTRNGHLSGGMTSTNSAEIAPLNVAAQWMASWVNLDNLGEENVNG